MPGGPFVIGTDIDIAGKHVPLVPKNKLNAAFVWDIGGGARLSGSLWATSQPVHGQRRAELARGRGFRRTAVADLKLAQTFSWGSASRSR